MDISEADIPIPVKLDMPGISKEAVKITIDGRQVNVDVGPQRESDKLDGARLL